MIEMSDAKIIAEKLAAIGEVTRMRMIHRLVAKPINVTELSKAVEIPMVNTSHHLGVMRNAGLVDYAKEGRQKIYSLSEDSFEAADGTETLGTMKCGDWKVHVVAPKVEKKTTKAKK